MTGVHVIIIKLILLVQIADDNANSSLLINGTELGDGVNEVETVQYFLYKLGMKPHINTLEIIFFFTTFSKSMT